MDRPPETEGPGFSVDDLYVDQTSLIIRLLYFTATSFAGALALTLREESQPASANSSRTDDAEIVGCVG